jgi:hypothetical protein
MREKANKNWLLQHYFNKCSNLINFILQNRLLVGSLGFEPRLPTFWTENSIPQAGILDQARLRPHGTGQGPSVEENH